MLITSYKNQSKNHFSIFAQSMDPISKMIKYKPICDTKNAKHLHGDRCTAIGDDYKTAICNETMGVVPTVVMLANGFTETRCISQYPQFYNNDNSLKPNVCRGGSVDVDVTLGKFPSIFSCTCPKDTFKSSIYGVPYCVTKISMEI